MNSSATRSGEEILITADSVLTPGSDPVEARGFLVKEGHIQQLFPNSDSLESFSPSDDCVVRDYGNQTILPGFTDAHTHMHSFGNYLAEVELEGVRDFAEVRERIHDYIETFGHREWILGRGWNPNLMEPERWPHWKDLEDLDTTRPVALQSHDQHSYWLNKQALNILGIDENTTDPEGGEVVKDPDGAPTGVLKEEAIKWVRDYLREHQGEEGKEREETLERAIREAFRNGITTVHDIGGLDTFNAYRSLREKKKQFPRVKYFCVRRDWETVEESDLVPGAGDSFLTFSGLKLFSDGTLGGQTAAMLEPYTEQLDQKKSCGTLIHEPEQLTEWVKRAAGEGFPVAIHAIGDRAVRLSLDSFQSAREEFGKNPHGHRIEHAELIHPDDIPRFRELDVIASLQPCHLYQDREVADRVWGRRKSKPFPVRSLLNQKATVYLGTDVPIEDINPLRNLQATVHRALPGDRPWYESESVGIDEALRLICRTSAGYMNSNPVAGTLQEGAPADFVVLSENPLQKLSSKLLDIEVKETYLAGERVYSA